MGLYFVEASVMVLAGQRQHYLRLQWRLSWLLVAGWMLLRSLVALPFECPKHQEYPVPKLSRSAHSLCFLPYLLCPEDKKRDQRD
jgi:hypothetical protein